MVRLRRKSVLFLHEARFATPIVISMKWTHTVRRGAGLRQYLTEVGDGQVHACQLLPHRLCQIQTEGAPGPDRDAQEDSCRDSKAERITHRSDIMSPC